jgi:methylmalonyl-CoA/ethylmalonyl-CoA epimerase
MLDPALVRFHHFGLAARDPARAAAFLGALGYTVGPLVRDPLQGVDLAMATHPTMPAVEIVAPLGDDGPLASTLRRDAEAVYHVCFETSDRARVLDALREAGGRALPVAGATPAVLFGGRAVSFHRVAGFGLIELLDAAEAA